MDSASYPSTAAAGWRLCIPNTTIPRGGATGEKEVRGLGPSSLPDPTHSSALIEGPAPPGTWKKTTGHADQNSDWTTTFYSTGRSRMWIDRSRSSRIQGMNRGRRLLAGRKSARRGSLLVSSLLRQKHPARHRFAEPGGRTSGHVCRLSACLWRDTVCIDRPARPLVHFFRYLVYPRAFDHFYRRLRTQSLEDAAVGPGALAEPNGKPDQSGVPAYQNLL